LQAQLKGTVEGHFRLFFGGACLITGMQFLTEYLKTQDSIINELTQLEDTVRGPIAESLWQYNKNQLDALVVSLVKMPVIEGVDILDKYAKNMFSKRSYTPATAPCWFSIENRICIGHLMKKRDFSSHLHFINHHKSF
jgi:hypothetical protein